MTSPANTATTFPATRVVHWPSGPVAACDQHSLALLGLARFLGSHVGVTNAQPGEECANCRNEAALDKEEK
jgi:hypothetical protein